MKAGRCFSQTVIVLVVFSVARGLGLAGPPLVSVSVLSAVLALIAWRANARLADLGLERAHVRQGLRWGIGAFGIVLLILVVAVLLPATNGYLHDSRAQISGARLVYELCVSILLLTAIPEEFAFRGVLLGSATTLWGSWRATLVTSALFGLWHIEPTLSTMSDNGTVRGASGSAVGQLFVVLGAVAVTFVAGVVFCWLRLRSKSLMLRSSLTWRPTGSHSPWPGSPCTSGLDTRLPAGPANRSAGRCHPGFDDVFEPREIVGGDTRRLHDGIPAVDVLGRVLVPWPPGTPVENGRSAVICQKVRNGIQTMPLSTSRPGGSLIQSGLWRIRCGLHQTIGSDGCIR